MLLLVALVGVRDPLVFLLGAPTEEAEPEEAEPEESEPEEAEPEEAATATAAGEGDPLLIAGADGAGDL